MSRFATTYSTIYIPPCLEEEDCPAKNYKEPSVNKCMKCTKSQVLNRGFGRKIVISVDSLECINCKKIASRVLCKCYCVHKKCCHSHDTLCMTDAESMNCCKRCVKLNAICDKKCETHCCSKDYSCKAMQKARGSKTKSVLLPVCRCRESKPFTDTCQTSVSAFSNRQEQLEKLRDTSMRSSRLCCCNLKITEQNLR